MSSVLPPTGTRSRWLDNYLQGLVQASSIQTRTLVRLVDAGAEMTRAVLSNPDCGTLRRAGDRYRADVGEALKSYARDGAALSWDLLSKGWQPSASSQKGGARVADTEKTARTTAARTKTTQTKTGKTKPQKKARPAKSRPRSAATATDPQKPPSRRATPGFKVVEDEQGARFQLLAADGKAVLTSRSYSNSRSARKGLSAIIRNARQEQRYERCTGPRGDVFFEIRAGNNRVLWRSATYEHSAELEEDIVRLIHTAEGTEPPPV